MCSGRSLLLSEYLKEGRLAEGREAARVEPFLSDLPSYSGLLTVDSINAAHLFFWFFPSEAGPQAPVVLWTNGMGTPSTYAVFKMTGPYNYSSKKIGLHQESWTKLFNVLYIDAPVGVGFSFFDDESGCPADDSESALHLQCALSQFFQFFPELSSNDFFISGVSFSGKHSLHLARLLKDKTKGVILGAPLIDGAAQIRVGEFLSELGLLDRKHLDEVAKVEHEAGELAANGKWEESFRLVREYHLGGKFEEFMGPVSPFSPNKEKQDDLDELLGSEKIREMLHMTGNPAGPWIRAHKYYKQLYSPATKVLEEVLRDTPVFIYWGQMDGVLPIRVMDDFLFNLDWEGAKEFSEAPREKIFSGGKLVALSRSHGNLTSVMVRHASHIVAEDEPAVVLQLVSNFIGSRTSADRSSAD